MTRSRFAFDPRLAIGLVLVLGSVGGVVAIVSVADETVQVYAATDALTPGDRITAGDLAVRNVRLDAASGLYLTPDDVPADGLIVARTVARGELVPAAAIGSVDGLRLTSVVLDVRGALSGSVQPGATVDVWAAVARQGGGFEPPAAIVPGATVVDLLASDSLVSGAQTTGVEVLVPKDTLARLLEAVAGDAAISIVPAGLPGR